MNTDSNKLIMTAEGLKKLKEELNRLTTVERKKIAEEIQKAMEYGDYSENAAFTTSVERRDLNEARIAEIEEMLEKVEVVTTNNSKSYQGIIQVGSKVKVKANGSKVEWTVVGAFEGNPADGKISVETPIGSALIGKRIGDKIKVELPTGVATYEILSVN